jgi:hypothetical protein
MTWRARFILTPGVLLLTFCFAIGAVVQQRRHDAHVHGAAEVSIAVEGSKATVEFRAPAESVMGFEHEAKSESDKKKRDAALEQLRANKDRMIVFDPRWGCKSSELKTAVAEEKAERAKAQTGTEGQSHKDQKKSGEHREVQGIFSVACDKPLAGSRITFGVYKIFPDIHEINVQVLSDSKQVGATIKKDKGDVKL